MALTRKQRGIAVCAVIALFLFARGISAKIDDVATSADSAEAVASEARDAASSAQDTADEANEKTDRLCNYQC